MGRRKSSRPRRDTSCPGTTRWCLHVIRRPNPASKAGSRGSMLSLRIEVASNRSALDVQTEEERRCVVDEARLGGDLPVLTDRRIHLQLPGQLVYQADGREPAIVLQSRAGIDVV